MDVHIDDTFYTVPQTNQMVSKNAYKWLLCLFDDYTSKPYYLIPQIDHIGLIMRCVFQQYESELPWPDRVPFFLCHREWARSQWFPGQAEWRKTLVIGWRTEVCVRGAHFQTPWPSINPHNYPGLNYSLEEAWKLAADTKESKIYWNHKHRH